jgi:hypothetical protein
VTATAAPLRKETPAETKPAGSLSVSVPLYVPITRAGRTITSIEIAPVKFDHTLRWNEGKFEGGSTALLAELTGLDQATLREMVEVDAQRVMALFMTLLPASIRADIERGVVPVAGEAAEARGATPTPYPMAAPEPGPDHDGVGFDVGGEQ